MKKYILLSLFLLINYLSAHAELDKITIAKSFLTAWKPTVILIHNYEGNIIHIKRIRKRDMKRALDIYFSNDKRENIGISCISIKENNDGIKYFNANTFFGITNNYELKYNEVNSAFITKMYNHKLRIHDCHNTDGIEIISGAEKKKRLDRDVLEFSSLLKEDSPFFLILSDNSDQYYYYVNDQKREKDHIQLDVKMSEFKLIDSTYNLICPDSINFGFRAHSTLLGKPVYFYFLNSNKHPLSFPSELSVDKFDVIARKFNRETIESFIYYFSVDKLPFTHDYDYKPYQISWERPDRILVKGSDFYNFFIAGFSFKSIKDKSVSYWHIYGESSQDASFILPNMPDDLLYDYPVLFIENKKMTGAFTLISSEEDIYIERLSSPFVLGDVEWLIKNASTIVRCLAK